MYIEEVHQIKNTSFYQPKCYINFDVYIYIKLPSHYNFHKKSALMSIMYDNCTDNGTHPSPF